MPHSPQPLRLARDAMATRFELVLHGLEAGRLRAAGEEALDEVERLERWLSLFRPESDIAQVNARAHREAVRVSYEVFQLLEHARRLWKETDGAFDPTIGPLMRCWGLLDGVGQVPDEERLAAARARTGMQRVRLDAEQQSVRFERAGMMLDLGAIGKGYAVEKAVELLREAGVAHALIHGGTSTIQALGCQPDGTPWKVALEIPAQERTRLPELAEGRPLGVVELRDESLSVSGVWGGKSFAQGGRSYGHLIDPRTGHPAEAAVFSAVVLSSATESDALSTALLVAGLAGHARIAALRPGMWTLVAREEAGRLQIAEHGHSRNSV